MVAHPGLVAGTARDDTIVMRAIPDLLVKGGAEGVVVAAHPDGRFVAIKVADGAERARTAVLRVALAALDFDVERLRPAPILGHGRPVGVVESLLG
jgi:L-asparaginase II